MNVDRSDLAWVALIVTLICASLLASTLLALNLCRTEPTVISCASTDPRVQALCD